MNRRRVVVTGLGIVSPLALDREGTFEALLAGRSGVARIQGFDPEGYTTTIAAEVSDFDPTNWWKPARARRLDRFAQLGLAAAQEAWTDAGMPDAAFDAERAGCICGSGIGGLKTIENQAAILTERGPGRVTPFLIPKLMMNALSGEISIDLGLKGGNWVTASACASAAHAIGSALRAIQQDEVDLVLTGGAEAAVTPLGIAGFCSLRAMSTRNDDPTVASRPFDAGRDGFVMGEGAGILVVEEFEHAKRRGAKIYCELLGYGATADAFHITAPAEGAEGAQRSMCMALKEARVSLEDVTYINAHGTSTPINDPNETAAIRAVFGDHADKLAVSSTKSMIGHLLGASAAVEGAVCAISIQRGAIHQTLNHETPGEGCDLDYVKEGPRETRVGVVLSNSLGFGGHNATLAFGPCD